MLSINSQESKLPLIKSTMELQMGIFHLEKGQEVQEKSGVLQKAKIRNKQSNLFIRVFKQIANRID